MEPTHETNVTEVREQNLSMKKKEIDKMIRELTQVCNRNTDKSDFNCSSILFFVSVDHPMDYPQLFDYACREVESASDNILGLPQGTLSLPIDVQHVTAHETDHLNVTYASFEKDEIDQSLLIAFSLTRYQGKLLPVVIGGGVRRVDYKDPQPGQQIDALLAPQKPSGTDFAEAIEDAHAANYDISDLLSEKGYKGKYVPPTNPAGRYSSRK